MTDTILLTGAKWDTRQLVEQAIPEVCCRLRLPKRIPCITRHLPDNLYVADATILPEAMGNPPILTIMALAKKMSEIISK